MTEIKLPNRRISKRYKFIYDNKFTCYGTVGFRLEDGLPYEVFLQVGKSGTGLEALARDAAIGISYALQHGATLEQLRTAMTRMEVNAPTSPISILLDMLATDMERIRQEHEQYTRGLKVVEPSAEAPEGCDHTIASGEIDTTSPKIRTEDDPSPGDQGPSL